MSLVGSLAEARVVRLEIASREIVADGMAFGATGPYEKLRGTVFFEIDPNDPRNAVVFDLENAPRNDKGLVEFSAGMLILRPADPEKGNGGLFFEPPNRGSLIALRIMNDTPPGVNQNNPSTAADFGNGFLLKRGYTLAWVGWEADILPGADRLTVHFPTAAQANGLPITERVSIELSDAKGASPSRFTQPLASYSFPFVSSPPIESVSTDQDVAMAELLVRPSESPRPSAPDIPAGEVIPASQWSFARCPDGPPGIPSTTDLCLHEGFRNDRVYQLNYKAKNPTVMGLGYVTSRDFISFLRHATTDDAGKPNPSPGISTVLCLAVSQTSQYLRDFVYQGFNEDEQGQRVCDGAQIHVMTTLKLPLNFRFAEPNTVRLQHATRLRPDTNFPRTYGIREDPLKPGRIDGILKRPDTDPKIIDTSSSTEYWQLRASLVDTDEDGTVDLVQPDSVRRYLLSGTQHISIKGAPPGYGIVDSDGHRQCQQPSNPTHQGALMRALFVALDLWVRDGIEPPESRVPRVHDGTLIHPDQYCDRFPSIPGVACNGLYNASGERYFGPRVTDNRGVIDNLIPQVLRTHQVLVPTVDDVGNDIAGIRHPFAEAPVATLTGWNLRTPEFTDGDLCDLNGMMIPLLRTRDERLAAGDPRPSLEELYRDHKGYVKAVTKAAKRLAHDGFLLGEDEDQIIQEADDSGVLK